MPVKGFKSVTLKDETYDDLESFYEKRKDIYRKKGIHTFSGFITSLLYKGIGDEFTN